MIGLYRHQQHLNCFIVLFNQCRAEISVQYYTVSSPPCSKDTNFPGVFFGKIPIDESFCDVLSLVPLLIILSSCNIFSEWHKLTMLKLIIIHTNMQLRSLNNSHMSRCLISITIPSAFLLLGSLFILICGAFLLPVLNAAKTNFSANNNSQCAHFFPLFNYLFVFHLQKPNMILVFNMALQQRVK